MFVASARSISDIDQEEGWEEPVDEDERVFGSRCTSVEEGLKIPIDLLEFSCEDVEALVYDDALLAVIQVVEGLFRSFLAL